MLRPEDAFTSFPASLKACVGLLRGELSNAKVLDHGSPTSFCGLGFQLHCLRDLHLPPVVGKA